jgi:hypothetical protein
MNDSARVTSSFSTNSRPPGGIWSCHPPAAVVGAVPSYRTYTVADEELFQRITDRRDTSAATVEVVPVTDRVHDVGAAIAVAGASRTICCRPTAPDHTSTDAPEPGVYATVVSVPTAHPQVREMTMASIAIWKVFPDATATGAPVKFPNQHRVGSPDIRSSDWIDHAPPEEFVHVRIAVCGIVTFDPADDVDANGAVLVWPPVV